MSPRRAVPAFVTLVGVLALLVGIVAWVGTRSLARVDPTAWADDRWDEVSARLVTSLENVPGVESVEQVSFGAIPAFDVLPAEDADEVTVTGTVEVLCDTWIAQYPHYLHPGPIEPRCVVQSPEPSDEPPS